IARIAVPDEERDILAEAREQDLVRLRALARRHPLLIAEKPAATASASGRVDALRVLGERPARDVWIADLVSEHEAAVAPGQRFLLGGGAADVVRNRIEGTVGDVTLGEPLREGADAVLERIRRRHPEDAILVAERRIESKDLVRGRIARSGRRGVAVAEDEGTAERLVEEDGTAAIVARGGGIPFVEPRR